MDGSTKAQITESKIISLVLSGDSEQYAELVRRHQAALLGVCRGILQDSIQAEDAAQDIFVKAFKQLVNFKGHSNFSTWLTRIAINHCLDLKRKSSRQKTSSWDELLEQGKEAVEDEKSLPDIEKLLELQDLSNRLLGELTDGERSALVLREVQNLSYEEIADVLAISLDAVKSRLKRARERIQEKARHLMRLENV